MFYKARNSRINVDDTFAHYLSFGKGSKNLIIIPGLGGAFKSTKGLAIPMSLMYRRFAKEYKVYVFSRREKMPDNFKTSDMANDIIRHMDDLGIKSASIVGVSEGGMIAQYIAIKAPDKVDKLVLTVTVARPNDLLIKSVDTWIEMANNKDYKGIMVDTADKSYTGNYLNKSKRMYGLIGSLSKKVKYDKFYVESAACKMHNSYEELNKITCPTLIIGALKDKVLGIEGSYDLHDKIVNSELYIYDEYSHGVYEQAKDFNKRVYNFLKK